MDFSTTLTINSVTQTITLDDPRVTFSTCFANGWI